MNEETSRAYGFWLRGNYRRPIEIDEEHEKRFFQRYCEHAYKGTLVCSKCEKVRKEPWYSRLARKWFVVK